MTPKERDQFRQQYLRQYLKRGFVSCRACGKSYRLEEWNGRITCEGDIEVDHIKGVGSHPELAMDIKNAQALCFKHHSQKTNGRLERRSSS